jgi:hypothetical protein
LSGDGFQKAGKASRNAMGNLLHVDIGAFEGVRLAAAPVIRVRQRDFDPRSATVMVVGSAIETFGRGPAPDSEAMRSLIPMLTTGLAREGLNLVTCSAPGIQDQVSGAYARESGRGVIVDLVVTLHPDSDNAFGAHAPEGFRPQGDVTVHCGMPFEILGCLAAQLCDVVVVVSGGLGSVIETSIAAMRECPIISLAHTGGAAEMIAPMLSRFKASNRGLVAIEARTAEEFERALGEIVGRFGAAGGHTRLARLHAELKAAGAC